MSAKRLTSPRLTMKRMANARGRCGVIPSLDKRNYSGGGGGGAWPPRPPPRERARGELRAAVGGGSRRPHRVCEIVSLRCNPELYAIRGVLAGLRARRDTECSREPFSVATCVGRAGPGDAPRK